MLPFAPLITADEAEGPRGKYRKTVQTRARILDGHTYARRGAEVDALLRRERARRLQGSAA